MAILVKDLFRWPAAAGFPRQGLLELTLDAGYATGGWPITPALFKFNSVIHAVMGGPMANGYTLAWDAANKKLKAFVPAGTEAAAADATLNGAKATVVAIGY